MSLNFSVDVSLSNFYEKLVGKYSNDYSYYSFDKSKVVHLLNHIGIGDFETVNNSYRLGILSADSWDDLNYYEDDIVHMIIEDHLLIDESKIIFVNENKRSSLYSFFLTHSDDLGSDIPHNIETIIYRILSFAESLIDRELDYYGEFIEY